MSSLEILLALRDFGGMLVCRRRKEMYDVQGGGWNQQEERVVVLKNTVGF